MSAEDDVAHAVAEKYAFVGDTVAVKCDEKEAPPPPLPAIVPLAVLVVNGVSRDPVAVGEIVSTLDFVALARADLVPPNIVFDGIKGVVDGVYGCVDALAVGVSDIALVTDGGDD